MSIIFQLLYNLQVPGTRWKNNKACELYWKFFFVLDSFAHSVQPVSFDVLNETGVPNTDNN